MLDIYKPGTKTVPVTKAVKGTWVCAQIPTDKEIDQLRRIIPFPDDVISSLRDIDEIPTYEQQKGVTFIVIRVPVKTSLEGEELEYSTVPIGVLLTKNHFMTISFYETDIFTQLKNHSFTVNGIEPVLKLFMLTARNYLTALKTIRKELYATETNLERTASNEEILQLLEIEKSLVFFSTALKSNELIIERIAQTRNVTKSAKHRELADDIQREFKQAMNMSKIYSIINSEMVNAFSSIISNNLNKVIKTLTVITIILMLPTLIASIYGMNVALPFQQHPFAFEITVAMSILLSVIGVIAFWTSRIF